MIIDVIFGVLLDNNVSKLEIKLNKTLIYKLKKMHMFNKCNS
jgi:hypothetical protein